MWLSEEEGGLNEEYFEFFTRFTKDEVRKLARLIDPPTKFTIDLRSGFPNTSTSSPEESLLVFLWCCTHPLSLGYIMPFFGKSRPWISRVWNGVLDDIIESWGERITLDRQMMSPERIEAAIGNSLGDNSIFDFIDGTEVHVCQPGEEDQRPFWSGHKKQHALGHLSIILPNGLFGAVFTGLPSAGGDATLCIEVGLREKLQDLLSFLPEGQNSFVYGDAVFGSQWGVLGPYKNSRSQTITPSQRALNQWLSTKRIVVEYGFGAIKENFKLPSYFRVLEVGLCPVAGYGIFIELSSLFMRGESNVNEI